MSGRPSSGGSSALVHELLSAARAEAVPEASRERVARELGIVLSVSGVAATTLDRATSPRDTAPRLELNGRLRLDLGWLGVVSALLVGAPGGVAAGGVAPGGVVSSAVPAREQPALAPPPARGSEAGMAGLAAELSLPAARAAATAIADEVETPPESTGAARSGAQRPSRRVASDRARARSKTPAEAVSATPAPSTLLEEVRQLDRVRSSLGRSDGAGALAALERYERTFAAGELRLEARVLRVAAEFAVGHERVARRLARELLVAPGAERYRGELGRLLEAHR